MSNTDWKIEDDYLEPYSAWKTRQTPQTSGALLKSLNPVIDSAVRTYGSGTQSPLLRSKARSMTLDVLGGYDPKQGKLKPYLMSQLQGLRRAYHRETQVISVPEQIMLDQQKVVEAEKELRDQLGRDPSDSELSGWLHLPPKRIAYVRRASAGIALGQLQRHNVGGDEDDDEFEPAVMDTSADKAWIRFIYSGLDPKDQVIMEHTLGLRGKPVLANHEIADKVGITPSAVSQRKLKLQKYLNMRYETNIF